MFVPPPAIPKRITFRGTRILEGTIPNEFAIQAAINPMVYLLQKNAVKVRIDGRTKAAGINGNQSVAANQRGSRKEERENGDSETASPCLRC